MFQMYKICLAHCAQWRNRNRQSKTAHAQIQPIATTRISVYNYNYSTKLSKSESQIDPTFLSLFSKYLLNYESILSFWVMRLYVVCEFTFMCIV